MLEELNLHMVPRQTPHRATRDVRKEKNQQEEIRAENQRLRRENARLRRDLERRAAAVPDEVTKPMMKQVSKPKVDPNICPECQSEDVRDKLVGPSKFKVCAACNWRVKI